MTEKDLCSICKNNECSCQKNNTVKKPIGCTCGYVDGVHKMSCDFVLRYW